MPVTRPVSKFPIPENAKRVFQGKIFDTYQWEQTMYDGSVAIFEKLKRPDTVNIIPITPDGKIILAKQEQPNTEPFIGLLGGRIDTGESPEEAAKRELLEEGGFVAGTLELWYAVQPYSKIDWACYTFIARNCVKTHDQNLDPGEKIETFSVSFDEFMDIVADSRFRDTEIALKILRMQRYNNEIEAFRRFLIG